MIPMILYPGEEKDEGKAAGEWKHPTSTQVHVQPLPGVGSSMPDVQSVLRALECC